MGQINVLKAELCGHPSARGTLPTFCTTMTCHNYWRFHIKAPCGHEAVIGDPDHCMTTGCPRDHLAGTPDPTPDTATTTVYRDDMYVCSDCAGIAANGTVGNEDEDEDVRHMARMTSANEALTQAWAHLVIVRDHESDGEPSFMNRSCDGCGSALSGDRYAAVILASHRRTTDPAAVAGTTRAHQPADNRW